MDLQQLRYLLAVNRTLNFSKAADEMFISQPTLSHQIKKLEDELGVRLITRTTRSVAMTDVGRAVAEQAEQVIEATNRIIDITNEEKRSKSDRLNIGILAVYSQPNISLILAEFQSLHMAQTVSLHFSWSRDLIERLRRKKTDIIITNLNEALLSEEELKLFDVHIFLRDRMNVIVSERHPLAKQQYVSLEDITHNTLFLTGTASSAYNFLSDAFRRAGLSLPTFNDCTSIMSVLPFVASGQGITVLSTHVANAYMRGNVKMIPIEPEIPTSTAIVTLKGSLQRPIVREFRDFFLERISFE